MKRTVVLGAFALALVPASYANAVCAGTDACVYTEGTNACVYEQEPGGNWKEVCAGTSGLWFCSYHDGTLQCMAVG